ncbi:MAG TPA: HAMP domain-containing protein, partial [Symbiobacteriaceae bacterium]|nr:HAMP domain-containing protein [Symbiobacteriaceae bacterium]
MSGLIGSLSTWSQAFSVRFKIMGLAVGMVLLMGLSAAVLAQSGFSQATTAELELRGISIANDVSARGVDMILTHDVLSLHGLVVGTLINNPDVRYVLVLDHQGQVMAHTFGDRFPVDLLNLGIPSGQEDVITSLLSTEEGPIHDVAIPILDGMAGTVRVGMSPERLHVESRHLAEWMTAIVLVIATLALIAAYLLTAFLTRPVLALVEATQAAAKGDLTRRAPKGPPDEIGQLIDSFNEMLTRLEESQHVKRELLGRVLSAQEEERRRLARELHDETSQAITSMIVGLRTLELEHPEIRQRTVELQAQASSTLEEIHNLILELRPRVLDELGLVPALRRH